MLRLKESYDEASAISELDVDKGRQKLQDLGLSNAEIDTALELAPTVVGNDATWPVALALEQRRSDRRAWVMLGLGTVFGAGVTWAVLRRRK